MSPVEPMKPMSPMKPMEPMKREADEADAANGADVADELQLMATSIATPQPNLPYSHAKEVVPQNRRQASIDKAQTKL